MPQVTVNGRFLTRRPTGVDRFAMELLKVWLPKYGDIHATTIVVPTGSPLAAAADLKTQATATGRFGGHAWEQLDLPRYCKSDLLVSLCNTGPLAARRQLVVLHDAAVITQPASYSFAFRSWHRALMAGLMRRATVVASVSKFSATELMRHVGGRAAGIEVIYESGEHVLRAASDPAVLQRLNLKDRKYVLAVGSRTLNKNFAGVVKAAGLLADLGIKVVAAGGDNSRVFAGAALQGDNLVLAGYVTDGELRALYENAQVFVFPSFYEGFGLPPLEAMHCGCPVVVSRRASLPEICGEAAVYCDPGDPADIASSIRRVLTSSSLRDELREAGHMRTQQFTWDSAAEQLEQLIVANVGRPH